MSSSFFFKFFLFIAACSPKHVSQSEFPASSQQVYPSMVDGVIAFELTNSTDFVIKEQNLYLSKKTLDSLGLDYSSKDLQSFEVNIASSQLQLTESSQTFLGAQLGSVDALVPLPNKASLAIVKPLERKSRLLRKLIIPASGLHDWIQKKILERLNGIDGYIEKVILPLEEQGFEVAPNSRQKDELLTSQTLRVRSKNFDSHAGRVLVFLQGNGGNYLAYSAEDLHKIVNTNPNPASSEVVIMNYRKDARQLYDFVADAKRTIEDAVARVQGDSSRVAVYGYSMGGGIGTAAVSDLVKIPQYKNLKLIADRTFLSVDKFSAFLPKSALGEKWNLNVLEKWNSIPTENKLAVTAVDDEVIPPRNSLGESLLKTPGNTDSVLRVTTPGAEFYCSSCGKIHKTIHGASIESFSVNPATRLNGITEKIPGKSRGLALPILTSFIRGPAI